MKHETQVQYAQDDCSGLWGKCTFTIKEVGGKMVMSSTFEICNRLQNMGGGRVCFLPWHPPENLK